MTERMLEASQQICLNGLQYVDDMVWLINVLCGCSLINRCQALAAEHIMYNTLDTASMIISPEENKVRYIQQVELDGC